MNIHLLCSWPDNCDYPLWRKFLWNNRFRFVTASINVTRTHTGVDYSPVIKQQLAFTPLALDISWSPDFVYGDWRDQSIKSMLHRLAYVLQDTDYLWFTEQDFFPKYGFWDFVQSHDGADVITVYDGERMHPCSMFVRKDILDKTSKNFGIIPDLLDHFGVIQRDLMAIKANVIKIPESTYYHMAGLSSNFSLATRGQMPNHKPNEFLSYMTDCMNSGMVIDDEFKRVFDWTKNNVKVSPTDKISLGVGEGRG